LLNYLLINSRTITGDLGIKQGSLYIGSEEQTSFTSKKDEILTTIQQIHKILILIMIRQLWMEMLMLLEN